MSLRNEFIEKFGKELLETLFENIYGDITTPGITILDRNRINDLNQSGSAKIDLGHGIIWVAWQDGDMGGSEIKDFSYEKSEPIQKKRKVKTLEEVRTILSHITFAPSCVNLGWEWEVKESDVGFLIRSSFQRPDMQTGVVGTGYGRWMPVDKDAPIAGIVKTILLCVELILRHEFYEAFLYKGVQILNPHKSLSELAHPRTFES